MTGVLIVEDDADIRQALSELLSQCGFQSTGAADGLQALTLLKEGARPALIVLDLSLPALNGFQLLREIEADAELREIPVAIMTGLRLPQWDLPTPIRSAGVLLKPFDPEELLTIARKYCARREGGAEW